MWAMLFSTSLAWAAPCGEPDALESAAEGGWLMPSERSCLYRVAARRGKHRAEASRWLLADAEARDDEWTWKSLAEAHLRLAPDDGAVWLALAEYTQRHEHPLDVVRVTTEAIDAATAWSLPQDDPRVVQLHRMRTYAGLHARQGRGIDPDLVHYARAWLDAARDEAPAVAWQLAGLEPPDAL